LLAPKSDKPTQPLSAASTETNASTTKPSLLSNVCCEPVDGEASSSAETTPTSNKAFVGARTVPPFTPPPPPAGGIIDFGVSILTVSDRAFRQEYEMGDLSGPAVQEAVTQTVATLNNASPLAAGGARPQVTCRIQETAIVPDEVIDIQTKLKEMASNDQVDIIFTTGGTGFAPRDVTPEATEAVLERTCPGLLAFVSSELSSQQPLASLSRGVAGILGNTFVVNLPGNPKGVEEIIPILLPILLHGVADMKK
jgi:gephyrin